jgi:lactate permease
VALALVLMLDLARLMVHSGLLAALQGAAVAGVGAAWPWWAPAVGALGSFVTGSATASNLLFSPLQADTAQALGLSVPWVLAGQSLGAAIGNLVCPHNLIAGAATVGLVGQESALLRRTVGPCLLHLALGGALLAWLLSA